MHRPMRSFFYLVLAFLITMGCQTNFGEKITPQITRLEQIEAKGLLPRNVDIWVPQSYMDNPDLRVPVLYMQDGQNLFFPEEAYGGATWEVAREIENQIQKGSIPPCIVVGIWNTSDRFPEYMPEQPFLKLPEEVQQIVQNKRGIPKSDRYLDWLVNDLKPIIDENFRTLPDRENTFILGSSMGGLISLYGLVRYPQIFGGAAAVSPHWPVLLDTIIPAIPEQTIQFLAENMPPLEDYHLYLDHGDQGLDANYQPWQQAFSRSLGMRGFINGKDFISLKFPGDDHNEKDWARRFYQPLVYLFPPEKAE